MSMLITPLVATILASTSAAPATQPIVQEPVTAQKDAPIPACEEVQLLPSGMGYCVLKEGGETEFPRMGDIVRVHYTGWNLDGTVFDSSRKPRRPGLPVEPAQFPVGGLIEGWNQALQLMSPGDQWKLNIPSALAYGESGAGKDIKPNADLIFEVELMEIVERAPEFVAWDTEAEGIITLENGMMMRVLDAGTGDAIPDADVGMMKFGCWNPGGGFVLAHTTQGGPMMVSGGRAPLPFMKEAFPQLRSGARVLCNVPAALGMGKRGNVPNLPEGSNEIWLLECTSTMKFTKPEFSMPAAEELTTTESGLQYKIVREGTGKAPNASQQVVAHYAGWLTDGKPFDNSYDRGEPSTFPLSGVIAGWTEGLQLIKEGGAAIYVIPGDLAYGERGRPGSIPSNATLVFYVELVAVK